MSRLPIRVRLTAAFALAMTLVLTAAAAFVYVRVRADMTESVDAALSAQAAAGRAAEDPEEAFVQHLGPGGHVLATSGGVRGAAIDPGLVRRARQGTVLVERQLPGIEGTTRILARPSGSGVVASGHSLSDRNEALRSLVAAFGVWGPIAIGLVSLLGYVVAARALAPVEAMRRRAASVSLRPGDEPLPVPAANDEVRRLGETLNEMLARLRASFERERRFVAEASHELRTPIAVVKAELDGALRRGDHRPQVREALLAATEECDHLAQLAEDLLVLARAADGKLPVRAEEAPAAEVLEGVRVRFGDRAAERGRSITVDAPPDLLVRGDPLRLRQALGNLLDNALRHGAGGIVLRARPSGDGVELTVADGGVGFGSELAGRAFERFTRGDEARTRGGTGLGLAIVRAIAEAHGGEASIVAGTGGAVRMWLPGGGLRGISAPGPRVAPTLT